MRERLGPEIDRQAQKSARKVAGTLIRLGAGQVKQIAKDPSSRYYSEATSAPAANAYRTLSKSPLVAGTLALARSSDGLDYVAGTDYLEDAAGGRFQNLTIPSGTSLTAYYHYYQASGGGGAMTDAQVLAAVERVDGAGSGLDADLLDGQDSSDFLPTSGPVPDAAIGNRTVDQTLGSPANTGPLTSLLSWLAGMVKGITGEPDWKNVPATTLKTAKSRMDAHVGAGGGAHAAATQSTPGFESVADKVRLDNLLQVAGPEVSVSGAVSLASGAFGKMHVCSGEASYTVTLPAASGNAGKVVGIRIANGAAALVTVAGSGADRIDGWPSRVLWAQESVLLMCTGSGWTKLAGRTRPMGCRIRLATSGNVGQAQTIQTNSTTKVLVNQIDYDYGGMADLANNHAIVRRDGRYTVGVVILYSGAGATMGMPRCLASGVIVASPDASHVGFKAAQYETNAYSASSYPSTSIALPADLIAEEALETQTYQNSGETRYLIGNPTLATTLMYVSEDPAW